MMKNEKLHIVVSLALGVLLLMLSGCTQEYSEIPESTNSHPTKSELIQRLVAYNDSIKESIPHSRVSLDEGIDIVEADFNGAIEGAQWANRKLFFLSNRPKLWAMVVCGIINGAYSSYKKYDTIKNGTVQAQDLDVSIARDKVLMGYGSNQNQELATSLENTDVENLSIAQIDSCAIYVAETHNIILRDYNAYDANLAESVMASLPESEQSIITHPDFIATQINSGNGIFTVLNSGDKIAVIMNHFVRGFKMSTITDNYLKNYVRRYRNEINQSNELTNEEKLQLNMGFRVMENSYFYWRSYQEAEEFDPSLMSLRH